MRNDTCQARSVASTSNFVASVSNMCWSNCMMSRMRFPPHGFQSRFFVLADEKRTQDADHTFHVRLENPRSTRIRTLSKTEGDHKRQLKHDGNCLHPGLHPPPLKNTPRGVRIIALSMILMRHSQEAAVIIHLAQALHPRHADQDREPFDVNPINQHFSHRIVAKI